MGLKPREKVKLAYSAARRLFEENPNLTVDEVARQLSKLAPTNLTRPQISAVRLEVRSKDMTHTNHKNERIVVTPPPAAVPPVLRKPVAPVFFVAPAEVPIVSAPAEAPNPEPVVAPTLQSPPLPKHHNPKLDSTTEDFVLEWVNSNKEGTIFQLQAALKEKFGHGVFGPVLKDTLNAARALVGTVGPKRSSYRKPKPAVKVTSPTNWREEMQLLVNKLGEVMQRHSFREVSVRVSVDGDLTWDGKRETIETVGGSIKL